MTVLFMSKSHQQIRLGAQFSQKVQLLPMPQAVLYTVTFTKQPESSGACSMGKPMLRFRTRDTAAHKPGSVRCRPRLGLECCWLCTLHGKVCNWCATSRSPRISGSARRGGIQAMLLFCLRLYLACNQPGLKCVASVLGRSLGPPKRHSAVPHLLPVAVA